jgi:hypothetical protein
MSLIHDAHKIPPADLEAHRQAAWERQGAYVAANSAFYRRLWDGKAPPARLGDLAELPFSDKAGCASRSRSIRPSAIISPRRGIRPRACTAPRAPRGRR